LRRANVGFAMATGTDVAKKASDVVILDDNFRSIVTAMKWGRNVNDNILKFIQFQTTVNVAAVFIAFVGATMSSSSESPLKPVHLLWLNLIMDTMAALALATEPPTDTVLFRPPRSRDAPLITHRCWVNIFGQAIYQIIVQLWLLHGGHKWFGVKEHSIEHQTVIFNVFVLLQVFNEFNARQLGQTINVFAGLHRARLFMFIIVVTLVVQYVGVTYMGAIFKACPLKPKLWTRCLLISSAPLAIGVILRLIPVSEPEVPIGHDVEPSEEEKAQQAEQQGKRKITFKEAAERVIAQLKVAGALSAAMAGKQQGSEAPSP
jgi:Ca2+-transporting ATPase